MKKITLKENGTFEHVWISSIHKIPEKSIEVSDANIILLAKNPNTKRYDVATSSVLDYVPPFVLADANALKISEIVTAYQMANAQDISYMSTTFQADQASQDLLVSVLSAGAVPVGFYWVDLANNKVTMTFLELQGFSGAILIRNQVNFDTYQTLKAQANAATSQAELDAINVVF